MAGVYELFALKYGWRNAKRQDHFIREVANPDGPMPMDYFVWLAVNDDRAVLIDTGFNQGSGERRGRTLLRTPTEALKLLGVDPARIEDVILTHGHYDHIGNVGSFEGARLHLQENELEFVTSASSDKMRGSFEVPDVANVLQALYGKRLQLHDGSASPAPGISVHLVGGHTAGMQVVRVRTARGWVVVASDASHYYENMESGVSFHTTHDVERNLGGFKTMHELADSHEHIIPGHDPEVMRRYPSPRPELDGIAVRLDVPPRE